MRNGHAAMPRGHFAFHEVVRLGVLWRWSLFVGLAWAFFCVWPGPFVGLSWAFCFCPGLFAGLSEGFYVIVDFIPFVPWGIKPMMRYGLDALCAFVV